MRTLLLIEMTFCGMILSASTACAQVNGQAGPPQSFDPNAYVASLRETPPLNAIYLWPEGNIPTITTYTENDGRYQDDPDFKPYMVPYLVPDGKPVKGAVMVCAGGAFLFRSNPIEGHPVARRLSELGYQAFVVNYRVAPYTMEEGSLDLARAVRFVRSHAEEYRVDPAHIAAVGFSAGGILCGDLCLNFDEYVDGTKLTFDYTPDELDKVIADVCAVGMIYSFYGRLSHGTLNSEYLRSEKVPPTFYNYGTRDPFASQFAANAEAARRADVYVEEYPVEGLPHGYGLGFQGDVWTDKFDAFLQKVMKK